MTTCAWSSEARPATKTPCAAHRALFRGAVESQGAAPRTIAASGAMQPSARTPFSGCAAAGPTGLRRLPNSDRILQALMQVAHRCRPHLRNTRRRRLACLLILFFYPPLLTSSRASRFRRPCPVPDILRVRAQGNRPLVPMELCQQLASYHARNRPERRLHGSLIYAGARERGPPGRSAGARIRWKGRGLSCFDSSCSTSSLSSLSCDVPAYILRAARAPSAISQLSRPF